MSCRGRRPRRRGPPDGPPGDADPADAAPAGGDHAQPPHQQEGRDEERQEDQEEATQEKEEVPAETQEGTGGGQASERPRSPKEETLGPRPRRPAAEEEAAPGTRDDPRRQEDLRARRHSQ